MTDLPLNHLTRKRFCSLRGRPSRIAVKFALVPTFGPGWRVIEGLGLGAARRLTWLKGAQSWRVKTGRARFGARELIGRTDGFSIAATDSLAPSRGGADG